MRVLLVGDTHGNTGWWRRFVEPRIEASGVDAVVQLGDFGYWGRGDFVTTVARCARPVFFVDGNHEHHPLLREAWDGERRPTLVAGSLSYLPRGTEVEWGGVRVLALGGAVSIDKGLRIEGDNWFAQESLSDEELAAACTARAQIVFAHDAPSWAPVPLSPREELPAAWRAQLPQCEAHRERMTQVLAATGAELWVHGHYHAAYRAVAEHDGARCEFVGLARDGNDEDAVRVLELEDGEWRLEGAG